MTSNGNWHIQFGINLAGQLQQIAKRFTKPAAAKCPNVSVSVSVSLVRVSNPASPDSPFSWTLLLLQFKFWLARLDFILKLFPTPATLYNSQMQKLC